jgi:hypothetical protein
MLNWLADEHWSWIHTDFNRLNTRAMGFEWVSAPLIAFTETDRFLFLINATTFLLLPGLVFSLFTRLSVRSRTAWHWMWLVPSGYGYLLQAGSIGNDLFGAIFALAAVDFALRAAASRRIGELCLSIVAAGLLTGSKASNLPLLLPCVVAWIPSFHLLRRNLVVTAGALSIALVVSFLPTAISNWKHCGDWTGVAAERADDEALRGHMALKVANNAAILLIQNLIPPIWPIADAWNRTVQRPLPQAWRVKLEQTFEPVGAHWQVGELQIEEDAGLGCGLTSLALIGFLARSYRHRNATKSSKFLVSNASSLLPRIIVLSSFIALLAYMAKSGMSTAARLVIPYYGLCLPILLKSDSQTRVLRTAWWRAAAVAVFGVSLLLTILSPARPLFPANRLFAALGSADQGIWKRARTVYSIYGQRSDAFAPARRLLPPGLKFLGLIAFDEPETSLWRPFGQRRIEYVTHNDSAADLQARGIQYMLVTESDIEHVFHRNLGQWLTEMHGKVVGEVNLKLRVSRDARNWVLIYLEGSESNSQANL